MKILLIEDSFLQGDWLCSELQRALDGEVMWIAVESEVASRLDEIESFAPDVALIDVMLRWADPRPDAPPTPPDWDLYTAGLRCRHYLASRRGTALAPVIFYTVLSEAEVRSKLPELPTGVRYLGKDSDVDPLVQLIREVTARQP